MIIKIFQRFIHTTNKQLVNKYANREKKMINKMIHGREKGRKTWFNSEKQTPILSSASNITKTSGSGQGKQSSRRVNILNKLFMQNITDLMATGSVSEDILGRKIEISKVKVTKDFNIVNVFWVAKGNEKDTAIQTMLDNAAISLRHELSQLRVMGEVPKIHFLKDKEYGKVTEIDKLLLTADFGPDPDELQNIDTVGENQCEVPSIYDKLPLMRQDLFEFDHAGVMEKITRNLKKTQQAWEKYEYGRCRDSNITSSESTPNITTTLTTVKDAMQKSDEFKQFLEARKLRERKSAGRMKYKFEKEIIVNDLDIIDHVHNELEDYLEEDVEDQKK